MYTTVSSEIIAEFAEMVVVEVLVVLKSICAQVRFKLPGRYSVTHTCTTALLPHSSECLLMTLQATIRY